MYKYTKALLLVFFVLCTISCNKEDINDTLMSQDICLAGNITIDNFPASKVFHSGDKTSIPNLGLGTSKDNAIVILLFDRDGILYTPERFNEESKCDSFYAKTYITDLKTFREITGFAFAYPEYVKEPFDGYYFFDAYQRYYNKQSLMDLGESITRSMYTTYRVDILQASDIIYTSDARSYGITHGHVAGVTENNNYSCPGSMSNVSIVESIQPEVVNPQMGTWWAGRSNIYRLSYLGYTNSTKRNQVVNYLESKVGEPYYSLSDFASDALSPYAPYAIDNGKWYCSKLLWHAYHYVYGVDIDCDGGSIVWPADIKNCSWFSSTDLSY